VATDTPRVPSIVRLAAAAVLTIATLMAPGGASAACAAPPPGQDPWASADIVFVGTVVDLENRARWATVRVEEVWVGPDQPAEVVVRGGPGGSASLSVERTYDRGVRYLFAVELIDGELSDSACSGTTEADTIDLANARPADARTPNGREGLTRRGCPGSSRGHGSRGGGRHGHRGRRPRA
jgi:hypothetical protein